MTTVVLFTRDLRVHDNPALAEACREGSVVPLFVFDEAILSGRLASPNRAAFLAEALADLRASLRGRGGDLVLRRGESVGETLSVAQEVGADRILLADDVSRYAEHRLRRLRQAAADAGIEVASRSGVTVVPPGELRPTGGDHYRVFTPYWRAWEATTWRPPAAPPREVRLPSGIRVGRLPGRADLAAVAPTAEPSDYSCPPPHLAEGGERAGRRRLDAVVRRAREGGEPAHGDLPGDENSRLSPYLHLGCVSPLVVANRLRGPAPAVVRQLAWRDFHHQVAAAFPELATQDYRDRGRTWREDPAAFGAWCRGRTGVPIVDAGMRQLFAEGWMHNRARLLVASYLTKTLQLDWRLGAGHFFRWLVDGDLANNAGNWQWSAGTGNDTRPNRVLNPVRQAHRFDPDGDYVRRYVPELRGIAGGRVHEPWKLPEEERAELDYPQPLDDGRVA